MAVELDGNAIAGKEKPCFRKRTQVGDSPRIPRCMSGQGDVTRGPDRMSARHIGRLRFNQGLAIKNSVAVQKATARQNQLLKAQVERAVKIAEIGITERSKSLKRIGHAN